MGVEAIAAAVVAGDALAARSAAQDWLATSPRVSDERPPVSDDPRVRAVAAGLAEMFAERLGQPAPGWTASVLPLDEPYFLVSAARTMPRLRELCKAQSPLPLRRRKLYAPRDFLSFA